MCNLSDIFIRNTNNFTEPRPSFSPEILLLVFRETICLSIALTRDNSGMSLRGMFLERIPALLVNVIDFHGEGPLYYVCAAGGAKALNILLSYGADPGQSNRLALAAVEILAWSVIFFGRKKWGFCQPYQCWHPTFVSERKDLAMVSLTYNLEEHCLVGIRANHLLPRDIHDNLDIKNWVASPRGTSNNRSAQTQPSDMAPSLSRPRQTATLLLRPASP
jgi:hypothetical protein